MLFYFVFVYAHVRVEILLSGTCTILQQIECEIRKEKAVRTRTAPLVQTVNDRRDAIVQLKAQLKKERVRARVQMELGSSDEPGNSAQEDRINLLVRSLFV